MTRLISDWIIDIPHTLDLLDKELTEKTGCDLKHLALDAVHINETQAQSLFEKNKAAVIRVNTGEGVIDGFDRAIAAALKHLGIRSFTCDEENVEGIYEAVSKNANILFMADDLRYIALNIKNGKVSENDYCTALGFSQALKKMARGLVGKDIAVLGYGKLGKHATKMMTDLGGQVWVYDKKDIQKKEYEVFKGIISGMEEINDFKFIFDATNEGEWMNSLTSLNHAKIVAPGIPLSFNPEKMAGTNTYLHEKLIIGTSVMLFDAM